MPAPTVVKYSDSRFTGLGFKIPPGGTYVSEVLNIGLAVQNEDDEGMSWVNPDTVIVDNRGMDLSYDVEPWFEITRPAVPDGTITVTLHVSKPTSSAPQDPPQGCWAQITSIYWHSIQGSDHTV